MAGAHRVAAQLEAIETRAGVSLPDAQALARLGASYREAEEALRREID